MYIINNAFKNITRSIGRSLLIGLIVLVISAASTIALAIRSTALVSREESLSNMAVTASITPNQEMMMEEIQATEDFNRGMIGEFQQRFNPSLEEIIDFASSEHVVDFHYTLSTTLNRSESITPFVAEETPQEGRSTGGMGDFTLNGVSDALAMTEFVKGTAQLIDGEMFDWISDTPEVLISQQLALSNGLAVGDIITLTNPNNEEEIYELTVVGIYSTTATTISQMSIPALDPANHLYLSSRAVDTILTNAYENQITTMDEMFGTETTSKLNTQLINTLYFDDPEQFNQFQSELEANHFPEEYLLHSPDLSSFEASTLPLENLVDFATTLLLIVLGIGGMILIVFNFFSVRERKYEIGVLTAIGIKKEKWQLDSSPNPLW